MKQFSRMNTTFFYRLIAKRLLLPFLLMAAAVPLAFGQPAALTPALVETVQGCTSIGGFHENISAVCKNGRYGYIRRDGSWVVKPKYEKAFDFSEGRGAVVKNGRLGFVDSTGKEVIACVYDYDDERCMWLDKYPYAFHNGMMVVELHGEDGVIDRNGKVRVPFGIYNYIWNFEDGVAFARIGHPFKDSVTRYQLVDTNGNVVFNIPDTLSVNPMQGIGGRCFGASVYVCDTEASYYGCRTGYMDMKGRVLLPPQQRGRCQFDGKRWVCIWEHIYRSDNEEEHDVYHCLYDLVLQKEVPLSSDDISRFMDSCYHAPVYSEGKCFVKKEVDGKKRVVVQDSNGRELWMLPLGVYDCQPWSEALSVVRLKDGQHLRYGLMDAAGRLSFTAEQLREAERLVMAQSRLSWPALQLDSQTVAGLSQLLEEAYQEKSEEKKLLFYQRCAELAKSYRRTDNDTLREVEEVFKVFYRALIGKLEDRSCDISVQSQIPHICFREGIDDLEEGFKKRGTDEDYESEIVTSDWWSGYRLGLHPEWAVIDLAECENFCPEMEEFPYGYHGLSVFRQIAKDFLKEMPFPAWNASEEYIKRSNFLRFRPSGGDTASCYCYNFWGNEDLRMESLFFDKGMKRAMLFYTKYSTFWDGEGGYCVMEKEGNEWKVVRKAIFFEFLGD